MGEKSENNKGRWKTITMSTSQLPNNITSLWTRTDSTATITTIRDESMWYKLYRIEDNSMYIHLVYMPSKNTFKASSRDVNAEFPMLIPRQGVGFCPATNPTRVFFLETHFSAGVASVKLQRIPGWSSYVKNCTHRIWDLIPTAARARFNIKMSSY